MNMAQVKDGVVIQLNMPNVGYLSNGESVSGYNLLPLDILTKEGWLPREDNIPAYDPNIQEITVDTYTILTDKVIANYKVV